MSKILAGVAAFALMGVLALPGPASAAERRADGLRTQDASTMTDVSSHRRWRHRRHVVIRRAWGPGYGYYPAYRPYYAASPYYGAYYAGYPYYRPVPTVSVGFGFGPRWWW